MDSATCLVQVKMDCISHNGYLLLNAQTLAKHSCVKQHFTNINKIGLQHIIPIKPLFMLEVKAVLTLAVGKYDTVVLHKRSNDSQITMY